MSGLITTVRSRASDIYSLESVMFMPYALDALVSVVPMVDKVGYRHIEIFGENGTVAYIMTDSDGRRIKSRGYCTEDVGHEDFSKLEVRLPGSRTVNPVDETLVTMEFLCEFGRATELIDNVRGITEAGDMMRRMPADVLERDMPVRTRYRKIILTDGDLEARYRVIDLSSGSGPVMIRNYYMSSSGKFELRETRVLPRIGDGLPIPPD